MSEVIATSPIKLIWQPELCKALGRSRYAIERWIREGRFPKPIKIHDQGCAWRVRDIEVWLDQRERARRKVKKRGSLYAGDKLVTHSKKQANA